MNPEQNGPVQNPYTNTPHNPPPPATGSTPPPRRSPAGWIYPSIIVLLLGACIYLFVRNNKQTNETKMVTAQRDTVIIARDQLQEEFNAASVRLDEMVSSNADLRSEVQSKDGEIARLKSEFNGIMAKKNKTDRDYTRARDLIRQLNSRIATYEDRIAQLEGENKDLTDKYTVASAERDSTITQNIAIKKLGSVLHASNIRMVPIDLRRGGSKERETTKAKRVDVLRILFDLDENRVAESGTKELFLRINGPNGQLLSNAAYGSGVTTSAEGESIGYTLSRRVELMQNQPVKDVIIDWKQDSDYARGSYAIEIYHDGYRIGGGNVNLR